MQNNLCRVVMGVIGAIKRWPPLPRELVLRISLSVVDKWNRLMSDLLSATNLVPQGMV